MKRKQPRAPKVLYVLVRPDSGVSVTAWKTKRQAQSNASPMLIATFGTPNVVRYEVANGKK